jgi:cell division septum initiation protein DivIVA
MDKVEELTKSNEELTKSNKELKRQVRFTDKINKELVNKLSSLETENSTLRKGLAECCDRLWYYFGEVSGTWSDNRCNNVYDTAKYYLEQAKKGEDDGGKY